MSCTPSRPALRTLLLLLVLFAGSLVAQSQVRVATWNVQVMGSIGSDQWDRAVDTLRRVDADVVALQEVDDSEVGNLSAFAAAAGYSHSAVSSSGSNLSGGIRLGIVSRLPITFTRSHTSASLSGDNQANDITRVIYEAHVQLPSGNEPMAFFILHLKATSSGINDFRRAVEIIRTTQAVNAFRIANPMAPYIICGDFNEDLDDGPFGRVFTSLPSGLPPSYRLGSDLSFPIRYDPFVDLMTAQGELANATQEDTTSLFTTRPASGRRLDYLILEGPITNDGDEVYNSSRDNGVDDVPLGNWLPKAGSPLGSSVSTAASDHFPVFADLNAGSTPPPPAAPSIPGSLVVSEFLATPAASFDPLGEWIELRNTTGRALDVLDHELRSGAGQSFTLPSFLIPPRGYVVVGANTLAVLNGGAPVDIPWQGSGISLNAFGDQIEIVAPDGTILDALSFGAQVAGVATERRDPTATAFPNNFGPSLTPFGAGDLGTPGAVNTQDTNPTFTTLNVAGLLTPGSVAFLQISAPISLGSRAYVLAASSAPSPGIPLGPSGRKIPLLVDDLFFFSLQPGNGIFSGFIGNLNLFGSATASMSIPPIPSLTGATIFLGGAIIDPAAPESVASMIDATALTIR